MSPRWTPPKYCTSKHFDPDVTCELKYDHDGWHRAEYGPPIPDAEGILRAQIVSWS